MGGKHKLAQRTKNNARPSSSSRSAEILGNAVPNFVGFSAAKDGGLVAILPGFSIKEDIDPNIDPNFQLVLKKFGKKDTTTKLKALNEFTTLVSSSEESVVCTALSLWPRYYCQLSTDVEHRIREATQVAHGAVVKKCGRSIAPYLKQLIPVWIMSQYDTYVPAALQAQAALEAVFPATKLPEVLLFCKAEILQFISANLTLHSADTLSNSKTHNAEEREAKYERVIIASLQGYSLLINTLPESHLDWLCSEQEKILDSNNFWIFGIHKSPQIRTSCFAVIGSLCQRLSSWFGSKYGVKAAELLLTRLNEKELNVTISAWENSIILMANIPEWSKLVDVNASVLPGICETLNAGGWGSAGRVAPLMLPLLAHLSSDVLNQQFCDTFFDAVLKGAEQRCVVSSKTECSAWMNGLAECLRYISIGATSADFPLQSLSRALRLWLSYIACAHASINPFTPLKVSLCYIVELIQFWSKQSLTSDNTKNQFYFQLTRLFWKNVVYTITTQIEKSKPDDDKKEITDIHHELLMGLKSSALIKCKKVTKVTFCSDKAKVDEQAVNKTPNPSSNVQSSVDSEVKQLYERELSAVVNEVCGVYLEWARSNNISAPILGPLYSLILEFSSLQLFKTMLNSVSKDKSKVKIYSLYNDLFLEWLKGDSMRSQPVVDITFSLLTYLSEEEQCDVLKSFNQLPLSVLKWCISKCISYPHYNSSAIREWLKGDLVHQSLISMTHLIIKEGDRHHANLLKMSFAQDNNYGILIDTRTCSQIISILGESLNNHDSDHLDMCASFASQLAASLCTDDKYNDFQELLLGLFSLNCNVQADTKMLTSDTWWEVNTSWQDAVSTLSQQNIMTFTKKASDVIFVKLINNSEKCDLDMTTFNTLVNLSVNLISCSVSSSESDERDSAVVCKAIKTIMKLETKDIQHWFMHVYTKSLIADILNGTLDCPFATEPDVVQNIIKGSSKKSYNDMDENELRKQLIWTLFCVKTLNKILENVEKCNDEEQEDDDEDTCYGNETSRLPIVIKDCDEVKDVLSKFLYTMAVLKTLNDEYQALHWYGLIREYYFPIKESASTAIRWLSNQSYLSVIEYVKQKSDSEGMYWSLALQLCGGYLRKHTSFIDYNLHFKNSLETLSAMVQLDVFDEFIKESFCCVMQTLVDEGSTTKNKTLVNSTMVLALRSIYLISIQKSIPVSITKSEFVECLNSPLASLTLIIDKYYQTKELMLYDVDYTSASWDLVSCNASIVRFLTASIEAHGWDLETHHWDFINITLSSIIQSVDKSKQAWNTSKVSLLACEVFKLFSAVDTFIKNIPAECVKREPRECIVNLPQEWTDIFSPTIHQHFIEVFILICENCTSSSQLPSRDVFFVNNLYDVMKRFSVKYMVSNQKYSVEFVMNLCLEVLGAPNHHILKYMAHEMLKNLTPSLIEADKAASSSTLAEEDETPKPMVLSVHKMVDTLTHLQECVDAVLSPYTVGEDNCILIPFKDSYNLTLGYLMLWETLLNIVQESATFLQYHYTEFFREGRFVEHLVCALFRLIPDEEHMTNAAVGYFKTPPELSPRVSPISSLVSGMACSCLVQSLKVGAVYVGVRGWWGSLPTRTAQRVETVVRTYVTPLLVAQQLAEVSRRQKELPNVEFSIHPSVNEVVCKYTVDMTKMELAIELCNNHPLGIAKVASSGGPSSNVPWITLFLSHQNGTLWQTILLWLNSIQRKLDSVSECYVCYCKLHPVTGKLPKITCQTCKNKSHNVCLKKWFNTSGKTTCPMCRAVINLK